MLLGKILATIEPENLNLLVRKSPIKHSNKTKKAKNVTLEKGKGENFL